jgi:RNA polymerase sigma-70 factor (ECF subfamily)
MDQAALIDACRAGDRDAMRAVYERYVDRIYGLVHRMTHNSDDSFDLVQSTFVRAFESIHGFNGKSDLGTWLHRIAVNQTLQHFRRRRNEHAHLQRMPHPESAAPTDRSSADRLAAALPQLSDEHRAILILKYQQEMSYAEIAEVLQIAPGTIASRLNRARADLRRLLRARSGDSAEETGRPEHPTQQVMTPEERR